jgi:hypothetical protein
MRTCYKDGEVRALWHHLWKLCKVYSHKGEAEDQKKTIEEKGKISRVQTVIDGGQKVYLVWWR